MYRKFNMLLSIILLMGLLLAPAGSAAAQAPEKGILAAPAPNLIQDPSLQASYHNTTYWQQASSNADWTVCSSSNVECLLAGIAAPRTGTRWGFFGIPDWEDPETINPEVGILSQDVTFPACGASLQFYLWIGRADAGSDANDVFNVRIDGNTVFTTNATEKASYPGYTLVTLDVSAYANGATHTLVFRSVTTDQAVIFNLDDISLIQTCATISGNAGIGGATLDYTGGSTSADGSGNYSFNVAYDWSGTVTPSKLGYTFTPPSKTYTGVITNLTGQNYVATGPIISGNVGVPGVTLSYTDGTAKTAISDPNGNYSFTVSGDWSGTVTPSHSCYTFTPPDQTYANVIANQTQDYVPTPITAAGCVEINVDIAGANAGAFLISAQGSLTQSGFPNTKAGPVKIHSTTPILGADRVIYSVDGRPVSFSETMGLPNGQLSTIYWLPWYNNKTLNTQLRIANVSGIDADVQVFIGGVNRGSFQLASGATTSKRFVGVNQGPVKIVSTQSIVVTEVVVYKVNNKPTSFSEMMAIPANQVDKTYWLPWYNNKSMGTELRIANASRRRASVQVYIGGKEVTGSPFVIPVNSAQKLTFTGIDKGPVKIVSTQKIVASERVIYKVNGVPTSFSEMMALPAKSLNAASWLPHYNATNLTSHLHIANAGATDATVHILIGGTEVGSPLIIPAGKSIRKLFSGAPTGLVQVMSENDIPIVVSERVLFKARGVYTSFSEKMGLPAGQLSEIYWLPWYNSLNTILGFGLP